MTGQRFTPALRRQAIELRARGMTLKQISREIGRPLETIRLHILGIKRGRSYAHPVMSIGIGYPEDMLRRARAALAAEIAAAKREARTAPLYRGWPE